MTEAKQTTRVRCWLWLIRLIGVLMPRRLRADWRQEREGNLATIYPLIPLRYA